MPATSGPGRFSVIVDPGMKVKFTPSVEM